MSNSVGHGLLQPNSSGIVGTTLLQAQANSQIRKFSSSSSPSLLSSDFHGNRLAVRKLKLSKNRLGSGFTRAVLATDPASQLGGRFKLEGDTEMQVNVEMSSVAMVEIQISNSPDNLVLHWGGTQNRKEKWILPSPRPEGSKVHDNQALRTPFVKSGSDSFLKVEIDDPAIDAIEFLIVDERQNRWYKDNGKNFYVKLPLGEKTVSNVGVPEDLVQVQAYLRWERNGKQTYTPEQEKKEFEEARKELQRELEKGSSLDDIRKKITKGEIQTTKGETQTKGQKKPAKKIYSTPQRINRKKRDLIQLLKKPTPISAKEKNSIKPKSLSALQLFSKSLEDQNDANVLNKKTYRLYDKKLLVLVSNASGKTRVHLATDMEGPITLHWALSERSGEWLAPPETLLPVGSISLDKAAETRFSTISVDDPNNKIQTFELELTEGVFVGMPFVLRLGENWVKNNDSDFYVEFTEPNKPIKDAGDGKGTVKDLLDKIASLESVAEQSFMHRFNIAADLIEEAKDAGELGLAGILVWMRFMATRQLVWNKSYCVKPREISQAQDRLINMLQNVYRSSQYSELLRMIMSTVGRGGDGDVGQRIRDEILVIQKNNNCKGGMMEEWHQKLHNNTSPDDVVICQALFILSEGRGMVGVKINPISGLPSGFPELLQFVLEHVEDKNVEPLLEGLLEAREELKPLLSSSNDRLKDLLFMDISLDSTVRTAIERSYEKLKNAKPERKFVT